MTSKDKQHYKGPVFTVKTKTFEVDGKKLVRDLVESDPVVHVICYDTKMNVYCIEEFRTGAGKKLMGFPAGKIDDGETPEESARREVEEEIGMKVEDIKEITMPMYTNPGISNEIAHFFIAVVEEFKEGERKHFPDEGENIKVELKTVHEISDIIQNHHRNYIPFGMKSAFLWLMFIQHLSSMMAQHAETE